VNPRLVTARLQSRPGEPLDMDTLRGDLERVYEMGDFQRVDFRIEREGGSHVLAIDAREKSWGPNFLRLGLDLEADFEGQGEFTVLADLRRARVNRLGAELKGLVTIGEENSIFTEFYQPLDHSGIWFVAPQVELTRVTEEQFNEDGTITRFLVRNGAVRLDLGAQFHKYGEIRLGALRGRATAEILSDVPAEDRLEIDTGGWIGSLTIDRLDNANFPRNGTYGKAELYLARGGLGSDASYDRLETRLVRADSFGRHTIVGTARWGTGLGSEIPFYDEFSLGGFLDLSGFRSGRLRGQVLGFAQIVYYTRVGRLPGGIGDGFYIGGSLEAGNVWRDTSEVEFSTLRPAAAVFAGLDTVFGPLYLGYGRADGSEDSFYLFLGQSF
jgi:NTE family protein